jgi:SAM-dependent methyltransferase
VAVALAELKPGGRALDVGAGRGRHSRLLAALGWDVTALDFSAVGVEQARAQGVPERDSRGGSDVGRIEWTVGGATAWEPDDPSYDLVLCAFIKLAPPDFDRFKTWLAPNGHLVVVAHAVGTGPGPTDPKWRYTAIDLADAARGLAIERLTAADGVLTLIARSR